MDQIKKAVSKEGSMPRVGEMYYFEHGGEGTSGNPVVFIHGAGGNHLHWPSTLRRLPGRHVLAPDLPGHGKSGGMGQQSIGAYAAILVEWLRALDLRQAIVVGHSMGGGIAQHIALEHPEHVRALVLVGTGARLPVNPDLLDKISRAQTYPAAVDLIVKWSYAPQSDARMKDQVRKAMLATRFSVMHNDMLACQAFDSAARLAEITVPTLIVAGAEDKMTPVWMSEALHTGIAGSTLHMVPEAGHMVTLEQPEACARIIGDFVEKQVN